MPKAFHQIDILVDVDGVLMDWFTPAYYLCQRLTRWEVMKSHPIEDWQGHYNLFFNMGISQDKFWEEWNNRHLWRKLKPFPWANRLMARLKKHGHVTLVTQSDGTPRGTGLKMMGITDKLDTKHVGLMIGGDKYLMGGDNRYLIDDHARQTTAFSNEGGNSILVPSNWNKGNYHEHCFDQVWEVIVSQLPIPDEDINYED